MIYLIDYDRRSGKLVAMRTYSDDQRVAAEIDRLNLELSLLDQRLTREIVLLEAIDEDALHRTHGRYFESLEDMAARGVEMING